jgi:hypothetical protein
LQELTQLAEYQDAPIVAPIVDEIPSDHEDNDEPPSPAPIQPLPTTNMPPPPIPSTSRSMRPEFLRQWMRDRAFVRFVTSSQVTTLFPNAVRTRQQLYLPIYQYDQLWHKNAGKHYTS